MKAGLLNVVTKFKKSYGKVVIDEKASTAGHTVLRLPPYHCDLNHIEIIWSQMKGYDASNNKTFKIKEVKELSIEAISSVDRQLWEGCIKHVIN